MHIWEIINSPEFRRNQRKYNSLFCFTALAAKGMRKETWTQPIEASMLTMHGRAYHRIFDLQQHYAGMNVANSSRYYIYDSEFNLQSRALHVNSNTAASLRSYFHNNLPWVVQYKSAVDEVLRSNTIQSEPAVLEFAEVSRIDDGHVLGAPAAPEIAAILYPSKSQCSCTQPIITYPKNSPDNQPRFLDLYSPSYEPLQFPCLFNKGESGWSKGHHSETPRNKSRTMNRAGTKHVPFLFYCRQRLLSEPIFQRNSRIAQEWCCDMFSRFEENKLTYFETDELQNKLRLASKRSISESTGDNQPGKLLPATFHGSPLKRKSDTEDALSIVNRRGRPQLFITITCNPGWPEIVANLLPGQSAADRPDLCCRVFKQKVAQIIADLKTGNVFSELDYYFFTIEYQQRGYPHCHCICRFKNDDAFTNMDSWVWAQLPSPDIAGGRLREAVLKHMIHRPCGIFNVRAVCMDTNKTTKKTYCNKHYPQPFRSTAIVNEKTGRAEYKRIDNGDRPTIRQRVNGQWVDVEIGNEWVVPYNPYLLLRYNCHICTDVVTGSSGIKYVYKYITKGHDLSRARVAGITSEIEQYRKTRYVSAAEATWRMLGYEMMSRDPAVTVVHAHLEGENNVMYPSNATDEIRRQCAEDAVSDLMRYFKRPLDDLFNNLTLLDYFELYTIAKKKNDDPIPSSAPPGKWLDSYGNTISTRRKSHVCRIKFASPAVGDLFYLRLILHKRSGRSYADLRTVTAPSGVSTEHPTFHDAARAQGLITGQEEYFICMEEAITFEMPSQLRGLFVTLILDGGPAPKLWNDYKEHLIEDFTRTLDNTDACDEALRIIDLKLQQHGKTNAQLGLPAPRHRQTEYQRMAASFRPSEQTAYADTFEPGLTSEQRDIYTAIIHAVRNKQPQPFMIDAPAGTGKSHTEKVIAARLRGEGFTVLIVASTGIAALQLPGGWTAHSMFKLPLNERVVDGAFCDIKNESQRAELIRKCDLIIFDELPMTHRFCIEALERTLRDIRRSDAFQATGGSVAR